MEKKKDKAVLKKKGYHPAGIFLILAGIACVIGGIYLASKNQISSGWASYKYSPGHPQSINGGGIIFFGILFIIIGVPLAKREKKTNP